MIFLENLIFRPENALTERALQNSQTIRTSQTGRLITGSLIFLENLIFRPENALTERALQNSQTIRTSQTGRLITRAL